MSACDPKRTRAADLAMVQTSGGASADRGVNDRGTQGGGSLIYNGWLDGDVCRLLRTFVGHSPGGRWAPVASRQIPCKDSLDPAFRAHGWGTPATNNRALRRV